MAPATMVVPDPVKTKFGLATAVAASVTLAKVNVPPPAMVLFTVWVAAAVEAGVVKAPALRLTPLAPVKFKPQAARIEVVVRLPTVMVLLPVQLAAGNAKPRCLARAKSSDTASPVMTPAGKSEEAVTPPVYGASLQRPKYQTSSQLWSKESGLRWHQQPLVGGATNLVDPGWANQDSNQRIIGS